MGQIIDLVGRKFERWTVVSFSHQAGNVVYWTCRCDCGAERAVFGGDLKRGGSKSCGCLTKELAAKRMKSHGMAGTPAYTSWQMMRQRCENPKDDGYALYGGRGISVDPSWSTFEGFWRDMGSTWVKGLSIDREDTNGNYCKDNCRWATPKQQARNRRTKRTIETPLGPMAVVEAAEAYGISQFTILARLRLGFSGDDLVSQFKLAPRIKQKLKSAG